MDFTQMLLAFAAACGIPTAITGLVFRRFEKRIEQRDREQQEQTRNQEEMMALIVQGNRAAIALGEATAHAMQRGHTNGDMEKALEYAEKIKHEQKRFMEKQCIHALWDD